MNKQARLVSITVVVIVLALLVAFFAYKYSPNKEKMELGDYFNISSDEMAIVLQDHVSDVKGYYIEGVPYISVDMTKVLFNKRFYWDSEEALLLYTTPTELIKIGQDTKDYTINKGNATEEYVIVREFDGEPYVAIPFVEKYSNIEYAVFERPNRIVISYRWDENQLVTTVKKETEIRLEPSIKSVIIAEVNPEDRLVCIGQDEEMTAGFSKVVTVDGVVGYIKNKRINESSYQVLESDYVEPVYPNLVREHDINMVWHQVTNEVANNNILTLLNETKGVNTISPTWFSIIDNEGNVSSIADERYVERAHQAGVEVWGLCDDFSREIDIAKILGSTTVRERLQNKLVSLAIEYNLDGLNLDFENVPSGSGEDFIQFVRELSIRCRSNGIVLSINDYVPVEYRLYYDYEEQGAVADYVVIMAYDEHYNGCGSAGSVSSIGFVQAAVTNITEKVPAEKVIMALPFYTRLWSIGVDENGEEVIESAAYGMNGADSVLDARDVTPSWESETGQMYAEYKEDGKTYKIWLEEETSLEEKLKVITQGGIRNVSFWRLGLERSDVWNVVSQYINSN